MHTYLYRANALFTVASTALAIMCAATALTDWTFPSNPTVDLTVKSIDGLLTDNTQDRAWLTIDVKADLRSLFHWNTKQAFVYISAEFQTKKHELNQAVIWSKIVERKKDANIREVVTSSFPYALTDPGQSFRNTTFSLSMDWETVPVVGVLHRKRLSFPGHKFPGEYFRGPAIRSHFERS